MDMDAPELVPLASETAPSRRRPWLLLIAAGVALLSLLLFWIGEALKAGPGSLDRTIILALRVSGHPDRPIGAAWVPSAVRDVTALGSSVVLTLLVALCASFLALRGRWRTAGMVIAATSLGAVAVTVLKALVGRSRPDLVARLVEESSNSFPSGHAANSAIVYLTMASLLFPVVRERRARVFLLVVALLLVAMIGASRVYLGVHWPSDVLAGWAFGAGWALLWWRLATAAVPARP
jgi:undecaprenyl-diphosphatase